LNADSGYVNLNIAKSTQYWRERTLSGRFSPLRSAPAQMIFLNTRSALRSRSRRFPPAPLRFPLRSRSAHMLCPSDDVLYEIWRNHLPTRSRSRCMLSSRLFRAILLQLWANRPS